MMDSQYLYIPLLQLSPRQHGQVIDYEKNIYNANCSNVFFLGRSTEFIY